MAGKRKQVLLQGPDLGYVHCSWTDGTNCCRYPGSLSHSTAAEGKWLCRAHFELKDPMMGGLIVQASQDYRHQTHDERQSEHHENAVAYALALGLKTPSERRAWVTRQSVRIADKMRPGYSRPGGGGLDAARKALGDADPLPMARDLPVDQP